MYTCGKDKERIVLYSTAVRIDSFLSSFIFQDKNEGNTLDVGILQSWPISRLPGFHLLLVMGRIGYYQSPACPKIILLLSVLKLGAVFSKSVMQILTLPYT